MNLITIQMNDITKRETGREKSPWHPNSDFYQRKYTFSSIW